MTDVKLEHEIFVNINVEPVMFVTVEFVEFKDVTVAVCPIISLKIK